MLVGVISDIHGHLSEQAYDALQPCDMILCAGDVERPTILMELDAIQRLRCWAIAIPVCGGWIFPSRRLPVLVGCAFS